MFWKKKKKKQGLPEESPITKHGPSFKSKVHDFWQWFPQVEERFFQTIEEGNCNDLTGETTDHVKQMCDSLAWVYGPGDDDKGGHSLTVTGQGIKAKQFLSEYWKSRAPEFENWTFYPSRQPGSFSASQYLQIDEARFDFGGLWITPLPDEEREIFDITVWHPAFDEIEEGKRSMALFILLDEILGEYGTDQWLGAVEMGDEKLAGAIPALELREYIHQFEVEKQWRKMPPTEGYSNYTSEKPDERFLRSDIFVGTTRFFELSAEYVENEGPLKEDPLEDSGAEAIFISYPSEIAPQEEASVFRGEIEDRLEELLEANHSGIILGGAIGLTYSYIDLITFDGENSLSLVEKFLRERGLPEGTAIHFFAAGNEGRRIFL